MTKLLRWIGVVAVAALIYTLMDWATTLVALSVVARRPEGIPDWARPVMNWGEPVLVVLQLVVAYWLLRRSWPEAQGKRLWTFALVVLLLNLRMFDLLRLGSSLAWARYVALTDLLTVAVLFLTALFVAVGMELVGARSQA